MKQGYPTSTPGYGVSSMSQPAAMMMSQQKPIRTFFKVPAEGVYKLAEEVIFNPAKTQRKFFHPLAGTKISFVSLQEGNAEPKGTSPHETSNNSNDSTNTTSTSNSASTLGTSTTTTATTTAGGSTGAPAGTSTPIGTPTGQVYIAMNQGEAIPVYVAGRDGSGGRERGAPLTFREMPSCLAFDPNTQHNRLELLIGFMSGDLLLYEPLSKTSTLHFNKDRALATGKVTGVQWVPGGKGEFVVSFSSGCLLFMDRNREDQPAVPNAKPEVTDSFCVIRQKNAKYNPVSKWCISSKAINGFAFSPSGKYIAVACQDGYLRVFDCEDETMQVAFRSYYGGFTCVAWSADGKYLATGGEDDLVCIWSPRERSILARGQGHRSWVTEVRFDPWNSAVGPNNSTYRLASVGEDTRLLLWDFERETLRRPRNVSMSFSSRRIGDFKHNLSQVQSQVLAQTQQNHGQPNSNHSEQYKAPIIESRGRNDVPHIHPLVEHRTHHEPVSDVCFLEKFLVTCSSGKAKFWARPGHLPPSPSPSPATPSANSLLPSSNTSTAAALLPSMTTASSGIPSVSTTPTAIPKGPISTTPSSTPPKINIEPPNV